VSDHFSPIQIFRKSKYIFHQYGYFGLFYLDRASRHVITGLQWRIRVNTLQDRAL